MKKFGSLILVLVVILTLCIPSQVFAESSEQLGSSLSDVQPVSGTTDLKFDSYINNSDLTISKITVQKVDNDLQFDLNYQSGVDRKIAFWNTKGERNLLGEFSGMLSSNSTYSFKIPAVQFMGVEEVCFVFISPTHQTNDAVAFKTQQFASLIPPFSLISNPYGVLNQNPPEYENGEIVSAVRPYDDGFSLFTKLPLGHTKATGQGINIGVIGDSKAPDFVYYIARNSKVYKYSNLSVNNLLQQGISIVAINNFKTFNDTELKNFASDCINNNIAVVIEGDEAVTDQEISLVNELESRGVITVGQVHLQGVTYEYTSNSTEAINPRLKEIAIDVFAPNIFKDFNRDNKSYKYSLYGVTGAMALLKEVKAANPADLKNYLISHSRNVWQLSSIDGKTYLEDYTIDNISGQFFPKPNSSIFYYRQLDFQYLLDVKLKAPWNANIYNITKAWELGKGNIDVALIDQGFYPESPEIKNNVVEAKAFGNAVWNENFHGTSMSKALLSVAPKAKLHLFLADMVSPEGGEKPDNIIKALDYCIQKKIPVISMSLGGSFVDFPELTAKIQEARDAGITVVWFFYPAEEKGIIRPNFIFYGQNQIAAFDRFIEEDMYYPQEIQAGLSCTSPQVAGLVALIKERAPSMLPGEIEDLLKNNSYRLSNGEYIPDMYSILNQLKPAVPPMSIQYSKHLKSKDLKVNDLSVRKIGDDLEFTLCYISSQDRKLKLMDDSKDGSSIGVFETMYANQNSYAFRIPAEKLSGMEKLELKFSTGNWEEKDSISFHTKQIDDLIPPTIELKLGKNIQSKDLKIENLTVRKTGDDLEFCIEYKSEKDRKGLLFNTPSGDKLLFPLNSILGGQNKYVFKIPANRLVGIDFINIRFTSENWGELDFIFFDTLQLKELLNR